MVRACISPVGRTCHPRQVGSNPAVAHPAATVGAAKRQKAPGLLLGPYAPCGGPMDEREVHRLQAGWSESVTET